MFWSRRKPWRHEAILPRYPVFDKFGPLISEAKQLFAIVSCLVTPYAAAMVEKHTPGARPHISPEQLQRFIKICEKDFGERLSEEDALEMASDLVDYLILFPLSRQEIDYRLATRSVNLPKCTYDTLLLPRKKDATVF